MSRRTSLPSRTAVWIVAVVLLLTACRSGDPYLEEYVTSRPAEATVAGVYFFKWQTASRDDPSGVNLERARLTLNPDGTFTAVDVPIFRPTNDSFAFDQLASGEGTWQLATRGAIADGDSFREIWGVRLDGPLAYDFAHLTSATAPHGLLIHAGVPTAGAVVYFAQTP